MGAAIIKMRNKALHLTTIPQRFMAARELCRWTAV